MLKILFTGVGRRIELLQAFRTAARKRNLKLKIYGADMAGTAPALAWCDETRRVCSMRDSEYIDQLLRICREDEINLLIPTIDTDLLVLSRNRDRFEAQGTRVLISAPDKIAICRDKNLTSDFFVSCGLHAPLPVNDYLRYTGAFPAFIKPKDGSSSINAFRAENPEELAMYASQVEDYIVQPFVSGTEYTVDIFCSWEGEPLSIIPRVRLQVRAGEVLKTRIAMDEKIIRECRALCAAFRPRGPMTVQLIRDVNTGEDQYIEINPRYGGGAPLSMKAGADTASLALSIAAGEEPSSESSSLLTAADGVMKTDSKTDDPASAFASLLQAADGAVYSRFDQSVCVQEGSHRIKGVIFDLDDTLYPEHQYIASGFKAVSRYLAGVPECPGKEGQANSKSLAEASEIESRLTEHLHAGRPAIDELLKDLGREEERETCLMIYRFHIPPLTLNPGAAEKIAELKARGIHVGIITDGRPEGQRNKISALGLDKLIPGGYESIIITDELGGPAFRKPCDIAFRIMAVRWGLAYEDMIYVGDNPDKDFQAPHQLGMSSALLLTDDGLHAEAGRKAAEGFTGRVIRSLSELDIID